MQINYRAEDITDESARILWSSVDAKLADTIQIEVRKLVYGQWKFHDPGFFTLNSSRKFVTLPQLEAGVSNIHKHQTNINITQGALSSKGEVHQRRK
jgi:hypothetical protein